MAKIITPEKISIRNNPEINEKLIQDYIFDNPSVLGLGDLMRLGKEITQPSGGRLDMLFTDDSNTRYEVELQLGATDPSHIIRTIEYWDIERKRYPLYDHCAVIIAEEITGRFLNVISLFNGSIPIIALQMSAFKFIEKEIALVFTKILDRISLGPDDEGDFEPTDRKYWEKKSTPKMLTLMDNIFKDASDAIAGYSLNYTRVYIGLSKDGITKNFIFFKPKKNYIWFVIKCPQSEEIHEKIDESGMEFSYDKRWKGYSIRINEIDDYLKNKDIIDKMILLAKENFNV